LRSEVCFADWPVWNSLIAVWWRSYCSRSSGVAYGLSKYVADALLDPMSVAIAIAVRKRFMIVEFSFVRMGGFLAS